jgi:nicotinamide mononucleotide transporter
MDALLHALQPWFATVFTVLGVGVTLIELVAFVLAIVMVFCNIRVNPIAWPLAIASSALYFLLFWQHRLYGDASLQVLFIVVAGWGWWQWLNGREADGRTLHVRHLGARGRWIALGALAIAWPATGLFLKHYTDTDVPWWDAFPTAGSLVGQWLLGRKYVENWLAWLVVNTVAVTLFAFKGLWLTVILYTAFVVLSVVGWRAWARLARGVR